MDPKDALIAASIAGHARRVRADLARLAGGAGSRSKVPCPTPGCSGKHSGLGGVGCRDCQRRRWRENRKAAGRCDFCGGPNPDRGRNLRCPACRARTEAGRRAIRSGRRAAGLCLECERPAVGDGCRCLAHKLAHAARQRRYGRKARRRKEKSRRERERRAKLRRAVAA